MTSLHIFKDVKPSQSSRLSLATSHCIRLVSIPSCVWLGVICKCARRFRRCILASSVSSSAWSSSNPQPSKPLNASRQICNAITHTFQIPKLPPASFSDSTLHQNLWAWHGKALHYVLFRLGPPGWLTDFCKVLMWKVCIGLGTGGNWPRGCEAASRPLWACGAELTHWAL